MSHRTKSLLFVLLVVGSFTTVATAQGATATVTGGPNVTGTAIGSTLFKLNNASKTLSCTSGSFTASVAGATGALPLTLSTNLVPAFGGCTIVGGLGITVPCQKGVQRVHWLFGNLTQSGKTGGWGLHIECHVFVTANTSCRHWIDGEWGVQHQNPGGGGSTYVIDSNHESLQAVDSSNGSGGTCSVLPNDSSVRITNSTGGDPVYNISPTNLTINVS